MRKVYSTILLNKTRCTSVAICYVYGRCTCSRVPSTATHTIHEAQPEEHINFVAFVGRHCWEAYMRLSPTGCALSVACGMCNHAFILESTMGSHRHPTNHGRTPTSSCKWKLIVMRCILMWSGDLANILCRNTSSKMRLTSAPSIHATRPFHISASQKQKVKSLCVSVCAGAVSSRPFISLSIVQCPHLVRLVNTVAAGGELSNKIKICRKMGERITILLEVVFWLLCHGIYICSGTLAFPWRRVCVYALCIVPGRCETSRPTLSEHYVHILRPIIIIIYYTIALHS